MNVNLRELEEILDYTPVICKMNPISFIYLQNVELVDENNLLFELDNPKFIHPLKRYIVNYPGNNLKYRFPGLELEHNPFTSEINYLLKDNLDYICKNCITNKTVTEYIKNYIINSNIDVRTVLLLLVDGLSYEDTKHIGYKSIPVFIDSPSLTSRSFPLIINKGNLVLFFNSKGFNIMGFNYWDINKTELSTEIFSCFSNEQVTSVDSFNNILDNLYRKNLNKTFIQIVSMGLDQWCHKQYEPPMIESFITKLKENINALTDVIPKPAFIFVISDHGILWKDRHKFEIIENTGHKSNPSMRYFTKNEIGRKGIPYGKDDDFWVLEYPYIRRAFHKNEWGCHGGLSYEESFVPLIIVEVK